MISWIAYHFRIFSKFQNADMRWRERGEGGTKTIAVTTTTSWLSKRHNGIQAMPRRIAS